MFPLLFRTDLGFVYTFTVVWLVGGGIGIWVLRQQRSTIYWDAYLSGAILALVIGRAQFVWENNAWFIENPAARWNLLLGGHSYSGAVLGFFIGLFLWGWFTRQSWHKPIPALLLIFPLVHFVGWLACYFDGCGYGAATFISWASAELPNTFGLMQVRYQTQLFGMASSLLIGALLFVRHRQNPSLIDTPAPTLLTLAILAFCRLVIYPWQGNAVPIWFGYRSDQWLTLIVILLLIILSLITNVEKKRPIR